ncbi:hypothetical protein CRENBAI_007566 [Crenichthys baileyi]|uniref:Uncharacterized protein n=1 Tax=Crenichthys baileyi TaxID=28760 RepID=A0AAV9SR17_9TELE
MTKAPPRRNGEQVVIAASPQPRPTDMKSAGGSDFSDKDPKERDDRQARREGELANEAASMQDFRCVIKSSSAWLSLKNAHVDPGRERRSPFHHMYLSVPNSALDFSAPSTCDQALSPVDLLPSGQENCSVLN